MSKPTLRQLLEAGVHFGHKTKKWNPKMKPFIFTKRAGIHVIDLVATKKCIDEAYQFLEGLAAEDKPIVFVGTKKQAAKTIEKEAQRCGAFYVSKRWIGGLLTNFENVKKMIGRLSKIEELEKSDELKDLTTKQEYDLKKEKEKLRQLVGGLCGLENLPGALFIVDPKKEGVAVREANICNVPLVALIDTNADSTLIDYPIPGNDDALRSIGLIAKTMADAVLEGKEKKVKSLPRGEAISGKK